MPDSLIQRLETNAKNLPDKVALTFLGSGPNGGTVENSYTYRDIQDRTDDLATGLLNSGLKRGDLVVLVFPPSLEFILAFMACLKAGIVAVPVFPPNPSRKDTLVMFTKIVQACGATFALTSASYNHMKKLSSLKDVVLRFQKSENAWPENLTWIVLDHLPGGGTLTGNRPSLKHNDDKMRSEIHSSDLAFLQFTSGSTSLPKGVMVTHHNLADNLVKITSELKAGEDTVVVSWLPQYHDMGLIGSYLGILYCGGSGYYMSPLTFLQRPAMWIEAVSKYRGTHLQAPNFAFQLTARKFKESTYRVDRDGPRIDLSCVKHIINAAEPVTEDSIESFCSVFCPLGLDRNVIFPTYGLAEHTVFVCSGGKQRLTVSKKALEVDGVVKIMASDSTDTSRLIGCGYPAKQNVKVQIVNTETFQALGEDLVGEIWIQSESKAAGYYGMPFETQRDFCAMIGSVEFPDNMHDEFDDHDDKHVAIDVSKGYLRTGDLGFLHNGELFICGRIKDLIIVGGRNYYPQDIEATAEASDTRFRPGCSAAFTVDPISGDNEQVALVLELREVPKASILEDTCLQIVQALRKTIHQEHSLTLSHIVLLRPRTIPKTTSGKITRSGTRKAFLQNKLSSIYKKTFNGSNNHTNGKLVSFEIDQGHSKPPVDPTSIRIMDKKEIQSKLLKDIGKVTSMPPSSLPLDADLSSMMDSLTLSQFKGLLETQYATRLSDEYLFREGSNVTKLVEIVKLGYAPDDVNEPDRGSGTCNSAGGGTATVSSTAGTSRVATSAHARGGLSEAMGCPPGVCCSIQ